MLEDQPGHHFDISAESVEADGLSPKLLNGFKLRAGDERERSAGHVAGDNLDRHSLERSRNAGADARIVIDLAIGQRRDSDGGVDANQLSLKVLFLKKTLFLCQRQRTELSGEIGETNPDFVNRVERRRQKKTNEQCYKQSFHDPPLYATA